MFSKKTKVSKNNTYDGSTTNHYSLRIDRKKKFTVQSNNYSAEYLCQNTSSSESLDNIIASYKNKSRKGYSLDRNPQSADAESKPKPKRSSWFLREKNRDKQSSKNEKFNKRGSLDFTLTYDTHSKDDKPRKNKHLIQRQNAADYSTNPTDSSTTTPQEEFDLKKNSLSKFQIGKRFLKGEIGIKSFNYYLLKEGLKKNLLKQQSSPTETTKSTYISKSEENIYEEIFFKDESGCTTLPKKLSEPKQEPPPLPPFTKQLSLKQKKSNDGNCMNCDVCIQEAQKQQQVKCKSKNCEMCAANHPPPAPSNNSNNNSILNAHSGYGTITKKIDDSTIYEFFQQQHGQNVLQFQSYNPNNPNVYKIETTPVAFGDYNPLEEHIYQHEQMRKQQIYQQIKNPNKIYSGDGQMPHKSSSSSDSVHQQKHHHYHHHRQPQANPQSNEFYKRPNYFNPPEEKSVRKHEPIYKTDSSASILSESNSIRSDNSLNRYNTQKNNQNRYASGTHPHDNMSDSSLGDSLFSYTGDASKRYFGSSESCRFGYECRRCSLETEKCSFSDTCRYECNLKNCDCSSSYFSSDFDDTNIYNSHNRNMNNNNNTNNSSNKKDQLQNEQYYEQQKASRYAEDFIKHVNNVKKRSQNLLYESNNNNKMISPLSIYEVPKSNKTLTAFDGSQDNGSIKQDNYMKATANDGDKKKYQINDDEKRRANSKTRKSTGTTPKGSSATTSSNEKSLSHTSVSSNESKSKIKAKRNETEKSTKMTGEQTQTMEKQVSSKIMSDEKLTSADSGNGNIHKVSSDTKLTTNKGGEISLSSPQNQQKYNKNPNNISSKDQKGKEKQFSDEDDDDVFIDNSKIKNLDTSTECKNNDANLVSDFICGNFNILKVFHITFFMSSIPHKCDPNS